MDIGASDALLSAHDLKAGGLGQFPSVIGGIVPVMNIEGVAPGQLKLDGETLAKIFLGEITVRNDPVIVALNKGSGHRHKRIAWRMVTQYFGAKLKELSPSLPVRTLVVNLPSPVCGISISSPAAVR